MHYRGETILEGNINVSTHFSPSLITFVIRRCQYCFTPPHHLNPLSPGWRMCHVICSDDLWLEVNGSSILSLNCELALHRVVNLRCDVRYRTTNATGRCMR